MSAEFEYPPGTILGAVLGSLAQGFATADSDTDRGCVYLLPIMDHVTWPGTGAPEMSVQLHDPDCWGHELRKFVHLARNCNPTILELLWAEPESLTTAGLMLQQVRLSFLSSTRLANAYKGFAMGQLGRATDPLRKPKARRHALRLLSQARICLSTGEFMVKLPDDTRAIISDMAENMDDKQFATVFRTLTTQVDEAVGDSVLPQHPKDTTIDGTVRWIRHAQIRHEFS